MLLFFLKPAWNSVPPSGAPYSDEALNRREKKQQRKLLEQRERRRRKKKDEEALVAGLLGILDDL